MAITLYTPKSEDIPSAQRINKMSLEELNIEIYRLSGRANTRLYRLEQKVPESATILQGKKLAAEWNPLQKQGVANRFSRREARTVQEARSRVSNLTKFLKWESSTVSGYNKIEKERIKIFSEKLGFPITSNEFNDITTALEETRDIQGLDSSQMIEIMEKELKDNQFENVDDLLNFIKKSSSNGNIVIKDYDTLVDVLKGTKDLKDINSDVITKIVTEENNLNKFKSTKDFIMFIRDTYEKGKNLEDTYKTLKKNESIFYDEETDSFKYEGGDIIE